MEAKKLMIGDYVKYQEHIYIIEEISAQGWVHLIHPEAKIRVNMTSDYIIDLLEPIPLTPEILEKNGWIYNNEDEKFFPQTWINDKLMLRVIDDYNYRVVVISDYDDEDTNDTPFIITYIHELQHILKLCEYDDLADNFKLK